MKIFTTFAFFNLLLQSTQSQWVPITFSCNEKFVSAITKLEIKLTGLGAVWFAECVQRQLGEREPLRTGTFSPVTGSLE